jgi:hypothetical protein
MGSDSALFVVHLLGFAVFLWHGLYVLTRGDRGPIARLTGCTALATGALFGFGGVLEALRANPVSLQVAVDRAQWWASVLPAVLWLHLSFRLQGGALDTRPQRRLIQAAYAAAAVLILLGTFTDLIRKYSDHGSLDTAGPLYVAYVAFLFVCAGLALIKLMWKRRLFRGEVAGSVENLMLVAGAACFLVGAGDFTLQKLLGNNWNELPAWLLLVVGLGAVGGTVGVRSNLLLGTDVRRHFLYSATSLAVLVVPYLVASAILIGFDNERFRLLALFALTLIVLGHTLSDTVGEWLDAAFFSPPIREERASARAYVGALATQPVGPSPELATVKEFDDAVRRAITHISDPTKLATSPLLSLQVVERGIQEQSQDDNRLNRAAALKEIVLELLGGLRPADGTGGVTSDANRYYNCLYYPYVRGFSRKRAPSILRQLEERRQRDGGAPTDTERVVHWILQVDEATFYRWQRRASDTIAAALREREAQTGGSLPVDGGATPATAAAL